MELLSNIQTNWIEWFGVVSGLLFLYLEIKQHLAMWIVGFITSAIYVIIFYSVKLYADTIINVYYTLMSIYGILMWMRKKTSEQSFVYTKISKRLAIRLSLVGVVLFTSVSFCLKRYTDSPLPYHDAFLSTLSIIGTWMLSKRYLQQWYLWIAANGFSVYLYYVKNLYPTVLLFFIYTIMSVYGYYSWKNKFGTT
jgi:nicotinamide mononucleotide transporter